MVSVRRRWRTIAVVVSMAFMLAFWKNSLQRLWNGGQCMQHMTDLEYLMDENVRQEILARQAAEATTTPDPWEYRKELSDSVTMVTASIHMEENWDNITNMGPSQARFFTQAAYKEWVATLAFITNPLYLFYSNESDEKWFQQVREGKMDRTELTHVKRDTLWAYILTPDTWLFKNYKPTTCIDANFNFSRIYGYYSKYEFIMRAVVLNEYKTKYFAWFDIDYFYNLGLKDTFTVVLPDYLDTTKVAYTQLKKYDANLSIKEIICQKHFWIEGSFFIGDEEVLAKWAHEFSQRIFELYMLRMAQRESLMIYAIFRKFNTSITSRIQEYWNPEGDTHWNHLGKLCIEGGLDM